MTPSQTDGPSTLAEDEAEGEFALEGNTSRSETSVWRTTWVESE
jgi:hypothetical protein